MDEKGLGKRLQAARQAAGLTQQGLCQKANLSYSTLAKIERGAIKAPSIFTIESIAEAVGVTLDELIGRQPAQTTVKQRRRSRGGTSFVYFDVNGCLVRSYDRAFAKLANDCGQPADIVETAFWHYNDQVCRGDMSLVDFNAELAKQLQMPSVDWAAYYLEAVEPMPEMEAVLREAAQHYGIGLMTNIMPGLLKTMIERGIVPNIKYEAIIDSSEARAIKPEEEIYKLAIDKAGCAAAEILFIDDSRANIMAAGKFGMHVLWFDDSRPEESAAKVRQALEPVDDSAASAEPATKQPVQPANPAEPALLTPQSAGTPPRW